MRLTDALTVAYENGWQDDTAWRRNVTAQMSLVKDGYCAGVIAHTPTNIRWSVSPVDPAPGLHGQRGTAPSLRDAQRNCLAAISNLTGMLPL